MSSGHNCYNAVDKVTVLVTVVLTELFNNGVHGIENRDSVTSRDVSSTLVRVRVHYSQVRTQYLRVQM